MGLIPATGSEISMGKIGNAYALGAAGTTLLRENGTGIGQNTKSLGLQIAIATGTTSVRLSIDFGGRTTPNTY